MYDALLHHHSRHNRATMTMNEVFGIHISYTSKCIVPIVFQFAGALQAFIYCFLSHGDGMMLCLIASHKTSQHHRLRTRTAPQVQYGTVPCAGTGTSTRNAMMLYSSSTFLLSCADHEFRGARKVPSKSVILQLSQGTFRATFRVPLFERAC